MNILEKDIQVLHLISTSPTLSQRDIAHRAGLSLGMINLILKRLVKTGHLKVINLTRRKMQYLLTPRGLDQKSRRAYEYFLRTMRVYDQYRHRLESLLEELRSQGRSRYFIVGEGEIINLLKVILKGYNGSLHYRFCGPRDSLTPLPNETVLNCSLNGRKEIQGISVLETILKESKAGIQA